MKKKTLKIVSPAAAQIVAPPARQLPQAADDSAFAEVLHLIQSAKQRAYQAVNTELVSLYWQIGEYISRKLESAEWGDGVASGQMPHRNDIANLNAKPVQTCLSQGSTPKPAIVSTRLMTTAVALSKNRFALHHPATRNRCAI